MNTDHTPEQLERAARAAMAADWAACWPAHVVADMAALNDALVAAWADEV